MSWHRPHFTARPVGGETLLCTRHQVALIVGVHPDTVKRHYRPVACDVATRLPLFDPEQFDPQRHKRGRKKRHAEQAA